MTRQPRRPPGKSSAKAASPQRPQTVEALCAAALRLLKAGQTADAEVACREALTLDAGHANALHAMGRVCLALKRDQLAIEWFARAIAQNPTVADYFVDLGQALQQVERFDEAIKVYDRLLQMKPEVVESWQRFGELLQRQNRAGEAAQAFDRALQLAPENADIWYQLGQSLKAQDRCDEAVLAFDQALKFRPAHVDASNNAGLLYFQAERYDEAIARFDSSLKQIPDQAGVLCLKCICLRRLRRYEEALVFGRRAHALAPQDPDIANSLGCVLQNLGLHDEAVVVFDLAIAMRPGFADFHNHRGTSLAELHRFGEAFASFDQAIALRPDFADAHWNSALFRLLVGDFAAGWAAREWGRKCRAVGFAERSFDAPPWPADAPLSGKTILLHSDEGLGDTIQFCRYATMVAQQGARVLLEVDPVLQPLLSGLSGITTCLARGIDEIPPIDFHCPLSALPLAFATRLETIPAAPAYLPPPSPERLHSWEARLGPRDRLRVGLVWSGNPAHLNDHNRSLPFEMLAPILDVDVRYVSLQKDVRPSDRAALAARHDILDLTADIRDFVDTAALISCLDLVLTVDTSVAHLAGALGKPTWIMLPCTPDYRWLLDRDDSPWYQSVRLFRQGRDRDYKPVIERVRAALSELVSMRASSAPNVISSK
jgi:tetratricopeptide (TPR) repeat protein